MTKIERILYFRDAKQSNLDLMNSKEGRLIGYAKCEILNEQRGRDLANDWLVKHGVDIDADLITAYESKRMPKGFVGLRDFFSEWRAKEFNGKNYEKYNQDPDQTEGYPVNKGWPGFYHQADGANGQKEASQQEKL